MFFSSITVIKSSLSIAATFWKSIVRWWIGSTQNTVKISLNLLVIFMLLDTVAWQHSSDENRRENTQESCHKRRKQGRLSQKRQWEGTRQHLQAIHNRAAHKWTLEIIYRNIFCCNFFLNRWNLLLTGMCKEGRANSMWRSEPLWEQVHVIQLWMHAKRRWSLCFWKLAALIFVYGSYARIFNLIKVVWFGSTELIQ